MRRFGRHTVIFNEDREVISADEDAEKGKGDPGVETLHFYYNREERLKHAPQNVRDFYNGTGGRPVKGLFRVLIATKSNRFILIAVGLFAAFVWFYSAFSERNSASVAGASVSLSAFSYEDFVYASLKLTPIKGKEPDRPLPVTVVFSAVDNTGAVNAEQSVTELYEGREAFIRTKLSDYDIIRIDAALSVQDEERRLSAAVVKR